MSLPFGAPIPFGFISCAEAGWPEVTMGEEVEAKAPTWLKRYLAAKRTVEVRVRLARIKLDFSEYIRFD
jgi:hypothetical protein